MREDLRRHVVQYGYEWCEHWMQIYPNRPKGRETKAMNWDQPAPLRNALTQRRGGRKKKKEELYQYAPGGASHHNQDPRFHRAGWVQSRQRKLKRLSAFSWKAGCKPIKRPNFRRWGQFLLREKRPLSRRRVCGGPV